MPSQQLWTVLGGIVNGSHLSLVIASIWTKALYSILYSTRYGERGGGGEGRRIIRGRPQCKENEFGGP